jgi:cell division protease FtsH
MPHLEEALSVIAVGPARKSVNVLKRDQEISAWHEAGHALAGLWLDDAVDPMRVTIVPRGSAGGATWFPAPETTYISLRQAKAQLVVAMSGRVGEELLLEGDFTHGSAHDLKKATELARTMVTELGMSSLGTSYIPPESRYGEVGAAVVRATEELINEALGRARQLLRPRELVAMVACRLIQDQELDLKTLIDLVGRPTENDYS